MQHCGKSGNDSGPYGGRHRPFKHYPRHSGRCSGRLSGSLFAALLLAWAAVSGGAVSAGAARAADDGLKLLMLGDSITAGYGLAAGDSLPGRLERALRAAGRAVTVIDGGVSGDTTAGGLARLGWLLADAPDAAVVALGGNDGLRGLSPEQSEANLSAVLERLQADGIPVLVAGMMAPRNLGPEYAAAFDPIFARVAARRDAALYPFLLDGVAMDPALNQPDGIHPNAAGVEVIVERMLPVVSDLLDRVEPSGK